MSMRDGRYFSTRSSFDYLNVYSFWPILSHMLKIPFVLLTILIASSHCEGQGAGPGIFALRTMLTDKNPEIRIKAAEGLGRVGGRQSVTILRQGLSDKNLGVRVAVVEALGFIGGRLAMTVLSEALKDRSTEVRLRSVEALKDAGTINSIPIIQKAFGDKEESVRLNAALMLRKIGNRRAVPALGKAALSDNSAAVRAAAAEYLGKIGVKDKRTVGILAKALEDKVPTVRIRAIESLGFLQLREAIPILEIALGDRDSGVRLRATEVMGHVLAKDFE